MRKITTFLFATLLFVACKKDESPQNLALKDVQEAVWGKTLTQINILPPFTVTIDDEISFTDTNGDAHTFLVTNKEGLDAPENPAYPGTCAVFEGEDYQMFVTLRGENEYRLKAKKSDVVLMEGRFSE